MAHYDIFRQELATKYPAYGHALWEPSSGVLCPFVEIGDVGFIRQGRFHRLFNALLPADHPSHRNFGVPEYHEPLQLNMQQHIVPGTLSPQNFCSNEVVVTSGGQGVFASGPEPEQVSFSCSRRSGAILSLPVPARHLETLAKGDFGKWMVNHIDLWYAFTRRLGLGLPRMEDIVLVTGCHLTRSWANIAFLQGRGEARVSFGAQVTGVSNIEWQFPPEERQGVALNLGPNGQNLPEDQCIFIRGFRVARLLRILPRLRGAAGPSQNPDQDEPELDMELLNISADAPYQDPLHTLFEYIAMEAPDCDMILVHDDDLMCIDNAPNTVMGPPRRVMPKVWQVQCGGPEAETPVFKVATLSNNPFGTPASVSPPLAIPASDLPSLSDEAGDLFSPLPTDIPADRGPVSITPFGEPGQLSHAPWDDDKKRQPMEQTEPATNTRKYDATTKAQFEDRGTSLLLELPKKDIGLTHPVKTVHDRGRRMSSPSAVAHMERSLLLEDVTTKDNDGMTPLHRALCQELPRVALTLLERGADAAVQDNEGRTPLHWASSEGHLEVIHVLIDRGADTAAQDKYGKTPLYQALRYGHEEVAVVLLEHGADATARNDNGETPLHQASLQGHIRAIRVLLDRGADTAAQDKYGRTPLQRALTYGREEAAVVLLEHGAGATARNDNGETPLHQASLQGHIRATRVLLDCGADTAAQDNYGRTPLYQALWYGHEEVALVLLEHGADATARNDNGETPLHQAAFKGQMQATRALLDRGADVAALDRYGKTPLHQARSYGHEEIALVLLEHGADATVRDNQEMTPSDWALARAEAILGLPNRGADVKARPKDRKSPFLFHGADRKAKDEGVTK